MTYELEVRLLTGDERHDGQLYREVAVVDGCCRWIGMIEGSGFRCEFLAGGWGRASQFMVTW